MSFRYALDRATPCVAFGKRTYTIELANAHREHGGMWTWATLTVKRGDVVVVTSDDASSLCSGIHRDMPEAEAADEVKRRVIYDLAWRETGL